MSVLQVTRDAGLVRLRLNRPEALNALDAEMAEAMLAACRDIAADPSVRAVLISGEGRAFAAGGDLSQMRASPVEAADLLITPLHEALRLLGQIDAPVLASLQGAVAGAGLSLAASADLAIAAEGTKFNLAYANIGASCDVGASWSLPRLVGLRRALEIALMGESFDARRALEIGLVNRVVAREDLEAESEALARRLAEGPTQAYGRMRRLMRTSFDRSYSEQLDAEREAFLASAATADFQEGLAAFFERRPARFQGA
jgi:2-(1,2-epoxy-1,2-dihydrophenyl)acetyl-CoA isomerase